MSALYDWMERHFGVRPTNPVAPRAELDAAIAATKMPIGILPPPAKPRVVFVVCPCASCKVAIATHELAVTGPLGGRVAMRLCSRCEPAVRGHYADLVVEESSGYFGSSIETTSLETGASW